MLGTLLKPLIANYIHPSILLPMQSNTCIPGLISFTLRSLVRSVHTASRKCSQLWKRPCFAKRLTSRSELTQPQHVKRALAVIGFWAASITPCLLYLSGWRLPEDRSVLEPVHPPTDLQRTPNLCLDIVIFHLRHSLALRWIRPKLGGREPHPGWAVQLLGGLGGVSPDAQVRILGPGPQNARRRPETRLT